MSNFFDTFPLIPYDIQGKRLSNYQTVTNIFFRVRVLREVLNNISAYYEHLIMEGDIPEILAEKVYGNSEAHWIILMANDIVDPQYDWPLGYDAFQKYIIKKYGSVENAKITHHHYEKIVTRTNEYYGTTYERRFNIDKYETSLEDLDVPYDVYYNIVDGNETLAVSQGYNAINVGNGQTVIEVTRGQAVTNYDYEVELNEAKRNIKIIKPEYYQQIVRELDDLTQNSKNIPYIRGFR